MAKIHLRDKLKFEKLLGMNTGYVANFSDRTFSQFIAGTVDKDIRLPEYSVLGSSKANRLRAFWDKEPEHLVGTLMVELVEYVRRGDAGEGFDIILIDECATIAAKIQKTQSLLDSDVLAQMPEEMNLDLLASTIFEAIKNDRPETAIDRLHTYTIRYMRAVCLKSGVELDRDYPLHSLLGSYIKKIKSEGFELTLMAERILKSSISTLEAYNDVRNDFSLAHDNPLLEYDECLLILNHVISVIKFIVSVEKKRELALIDA